MTQAQTKTLRMLRTNSGLSVSVSSEIKPKGSVMGRAFILLGVGLMGFYMAELPPAICLMFGFGLLAITRAIKGAK